ncbi:DUF1294 domain-containing protein [Flavobacterium columnare NBRC 100251 = ATCC 23463]|uniref:DUF1294 domain-containing protein n=1 Tax=Flavobacterium columnare TaxID=996 RepID=A0AAI8GBC4_9FLAO|nr:DUF1294 domain-containing protein [Flavobacterium columnare]AMO20463.1 DUF1294 domain-containing protein [Flavobacterium columnare]APT22338.1 hypothetical protein BU993_06675 [Flavobacterium columnare]AUX18428.1 hypothetical protein AQ623_09200 [Flavobacterium columnare]MBF6653333.1 DUF1294 domain-containing protein [Flavobacterium columnare]MBF6655687.1 DUF1294 domain-containing protein [Flavobacterium columnare]
MKMFLTYLLIVNILSLIVFGIDKLLAIKNKRRISEKDLLSISLIGGAIGSLLGMFIFKHKTSKISFIWRFTIIFIANVIGIYFLLK